VHQQEQEERKDSRVHDGDHESDQDEDYGNEVDVEEEGMTEA